jgi:hypothetical protein
LNLNFKNKIFNICLKGGKKRMRVKYFSGLLLVLILIGSLTLVYAATQPSGSTLTPIANETAPADPPASISAFAGNVTEVNVFGYSTTQAWQGYFGNITGVIELTDNLNRTMYNWTQANPRGEVYASIDAAILWTNIQCFNFTANGTNCSADSANRGATSKCGLNESGLEDMYGINFTSDIEGLNETFNRKDHALFYTNSLEFGVGECPNTKVYNSSGNGLFDEALMWAPDNNATVFVSIIQNNGNGFDGATHDFEMLVLDDGHGTDLAITTYYFYVEIY